MLRRLFLLRSGDPREAEAFHGRLQQARVARRTLQAEDLPDLLGAQAFELMAPVVNAEPAMNAHFVPESVLRALFIHYKVPSGRIGAILDQRASVEWTEGDLEERIGAPYRATLLRQYLGTRTWFWRIEVSAGGATLARVVARTPDREGVPSGELRLVEEVYTP